MCPAHPPAGIATTPLCLFTYGTEPPVVVCAAADSVRPGDVPGLYVTSHRLPATAGMRVCVQPRCTPTNTERALARTTATNVVGDRTMNAHTAGTH